MLKFFIIDDDPVCRRMLEHIIEDSLLGKITGSSSGGHAGIEDALNERPDVILIDLLMPEIDGLSVIAELKKQGYGGKFIMISQIDNKEMVGAAYQMGIEFFIHKPINKIEVEAVISKVKEQLQLDRSINEIRQSLANIERTSSFSTVIENDQKVKEVVQSLLMDIGILGESGSKDMVLAMEALVERKETDFPILKDIYEMIALQTDPHLSEEQLRREVRAIEQRIRRAVLAAVTNIASIGLTDYTNPKFEHYAPLFFDFKDVRLKMNEIENEQAKSRVKINVRKFLQVLYIETLEKLKTK